jgi:integral membrane protein
VFKLLRTPVGRLRAIALVEGVSYLVLLGVAMPLKYFAGLPEAVKAVGWAHGVLFVLFLISLAEVAFKRRWRLTRIVAAFVSALVPFGTFVLDARLRREWA